MTRQHCLSKTVRRTMLLEGSACAMEAFAEEVRRRDGSAEYVQYLEDNARELKQLGKELKTEARH